MTEETTEQPDLEKLEKRVLGLKRQNLSMLQTLEQVGVKIDLAQPRAEFMMQALEQLGIITYEQRLQEQEAWERNLRGQIQPVLQEVKAKMSGPIVPQSAPLWTPGQPR